MYKDNSSGNYCESKYGKCDRIDNCGYHLKPNSNDIISVVSQNQVIKKELIYFDLQTFKLTLQQNRYDKNVFINNLLSNVPYPFDAVDVSKVISLYYLGTVVNGVRSGAVCFPFMDQQNNIRAVQVKQFDKNNHTTGTDFLHSIIERNCVKNNIPVPDWIKAYNTNDTKVSCLFGEHLLSKFPNSNVALVEAPKSAIYGSLYFGNPQNDGDLIWLAVYNKSSFSFDKIKPLKGRTVIVFPDLSSGSTTYNDWLDKANRYQKTINIKFRFSNILEEAADEISKEKGLDIADYLENKDWRLFRELTNYS